MLKVPRAVTGVARPIANGARVIGLGYQRRQFQETGASTAKALPPRTKVNEDDIEEAFLKGSGPGGQKINKTSSAVQLIHKPTGLVVKAQDTRSREQNRKLARERLGEKIQYLEKGDESRVALKAKAAAKKKASATKKSRRKYRALEEAKKSVESGSSEANEQSGSAAS